MMLILDFESEPLRAILELFESKEVEESIYEGDVSPYQLKHPRADTNLDSVHKTQGGEFASPKGSDKNCAHKINDKYVDPSKSDKLETPSFMIHGAGHFSEDCKFLWDYWFKYKKTDV